MRVGNLAVIASLMAMSAATTAPQPSDRPAKSSPKPKRRRYYDPSQSPQPARPQPTHSPIVIAKITRQLRRQAKNDPELAAFIAEHDRRKALPPELLP